MDLGRRWRWGLPHHECRFHVPLGDWGPMLKPNGIRAHFSGQAAPGHTPGKVRLELVKPSAPYSVCIVACGRLAELPTTSLRGPRPVMVRLTETQRLDLENVFHNEQCME